MASRSSAGHLIALLHEDNEQLQEFALKRLHDEVDVFWAEISEEISLIEELSEQPTFQKRHLAASLASKCFYHMEAYDDALRKALEAGDHFDINEGSEYTETVVSKCLDDYIAACVAADESGEEKAIGANLINVVERMFEKCLAQGYVQQALGIAVDARQLNKIEQCIRGAPDPAKMLSHVFKLCRTTITNRGFRRRVMDVLAGLYEHLGDPDWVNVCQCLQFLNDSKKVAGVLMNLIRGTEAQAMEALQVAFMLVENENQQFLIDVCTALPGGAPPATEPKATATADEAGADAAGEAGAEAAGAAGAEAASATTEPVAPTLTAPQKKRLKQLRSVVSGSVSVNEYLSFLHSHNKTEMQLLDVFKNATSKNKNSVLHNAIVISHAYMNAGTTSDVFLRNNIEWLGQANNYARFTTIACLGVVHKGHMQDGLSSTKKFLDPYLPKAGEAAQPYAEGGALYALGLIHANTGGSDSETVAYLEQQLQGNASHVVKHGACLGLGFTAMAAGTESLYGVIKETLDASDKAVSGEAAAVALGLINMGRGADSGRAIEDMLTFAHATRHEKIIRGLGLGVALIMYQQEEAAETVIEQLVRDKNPLIRYGGVFTVALAYCGSSNNKALQRLLHIAVSDVSDDVKRVAVIALGYVLMRDPDKVPELVSLLSHSYSAHMRYGACFAVGIACAGTSSPAALRLLKPLLKDKVDYVRQGAMIAESMIVMQDASHYKRCRDKYLSVITDKHQNTMSKMGAILSTGILNAGGRNIVVSLQSAAGFRKMAAVAGMTMFLQHWYWYPYTAALSLTFSPTAIIGLNKDMKMPKDFSTLCNAKPSTFAYPEPLEQKVEKKKERVKTAVLSTTAANKARRRDKDAKDTDTMDVEDEAAAAASATTGDAAAGAAAAAGTGAADDKDGAKEDKAEEEKAPEPTSFKIANPGRVTLQQQQFVTFDATQRYRPVLPIKRGIVMLIDSAPERPEELVVLDQPSEDGDNSNEPAPPKPFIWTAPN